MVSYFVDSIYGLNWCFEEFLHFINLWNAKKCSLSRWAKWSIDIHTTKSPTLLFMTVKFWNRTTTQFWMLRLRFLALLSKLSFQAELLIAKWIQMWILILVNLTWSTFSIEINPTNWFTKYCMEGRLQNVRVFQSLLPVQYSSTVKHMESFAPDE
jgi:hypothetical protein